jgi:RNA polymerase primary sigma factor
LEKLTKANLRFVVSVAKQFKSSGLTLGDLINEGNVGLIQAAKRFDETRGFKFISYAVWWIRQSIIQALSESSRTVRLPSNKVSAINKLTRIASELEQNLMREPTIEEMAKASELSEKQVSECFVSRQRQLSIDAPFVDGEENGLLQVLEDTTMEMPDANLNLESLQKEIERALATLTDRESKVLHCYYGLKGTHCMTLEDIGIKFNLTRERVRQIKEKAIRRLQHTSRANALRPYLH